MEDKIKVKCKANEFGFTKEEIYIADRTITGGFIVKNDEGTEHLVFLTDFFNLFEEIKEYSLMDLLDFPVGTKFNAILFNELGKQKVTVEVQENTNKIKAIICNDIDEENQRIEFTQIWAKAKYTLIEEPKPVSTTEAFKAIGEGKEVQSLYSKMHYKTINNSIMSKGNHEGEEFELSDYISGGEIRGQWIIKGDSEC